VRNLAFITSNDSLRVTFHGVRGSTPCHGDDIQQYGGNTSCVSVAIPGEAPVIFDMGTGLRYFGQSQPLDGSFRGTCLLTHFHWDHTQGLPFFTPILKAGSELDIYAPAQEDGRSVQEVFAASIRPPLFPIPIDLFPGTIRFHDVSDSEFDIGDVHVTARLVPHVGATVGYRIDWHGRSVAYISDHQQPYDGSYSVSAGALDLARDVDLLIHDSQYSEAEFELKSTWGHCTPRYAVWLACHARAKTLALFHHDPMRVDGDLEATLAGLRVEGARGGVEVVAAAEGLTIVVE
jgi:phosphoribosyl 1,2-cyclic phosphodiesterase